MSYTYELRLHNDLPPILFRYIENYFPETDTKIKIYDHYKLNIMLTNGLAAILNKNNDILQAFCGDLLFFSPAEIHHGRVLRQGIHQYIEFLIPTDLFDTLFPNQKIHLEIFDENTPNRTNFIHPNMEDREKILLLSERFKAAILQPETTDDVQRFFLLMNLLDLCEKIYGRGDSDLGAEQIPAVLKKSIQYIKENYGEPLTIEDIAAQSNCSTSYLSRIFKQYVGKTPYGFLTEYRLFHAEKLLRSGESVTTAASVSGFCNSSAFIKAFRKSFGSTPLKYKKQIKNRL